MVEQKDGFEKEPFVICTTLPEKSVEAFQEVARKFLR